MLKDRREEGSPSGQRPGPKAGALTLAVLSTLNNFRSVVASGCRNEFLSLPGACLISLIVKTSNPVEFSLTGTFFLLFHFYSIILLL